MKLLAMNIHQRDVCPHTPHIAAKAVVMRTVIITLRNKVFPPAINPGPSSPKLNPPYGQVNFLSVKRHFMI
jgi:hypothetical protein